MQRLLCALLLLGSTAARARSPEREAVGFSVAWDAGFGTNVYVVGSHPDLASWAPTGGIKLRWTAGNVWTGQVAVQKGTALEYKFIARSGASNEYCNGANAVWEGGGNRTTNTPAAPPAPYSGKTVFYYSGWTSAALVAVSGTNVATHPMQRAGEGRAPGEFLYRADGVGEEGEGLEFALNGWFNGTNHWDNPPDTNWNHNYHTPLDVLLVQDGQVYNYGPADTVSAPRYEDRWADSLYPPVSGRTVRIWLPRGYDSHPWKRYPVIYMQDGQNMADPANPGGTGSWQFDAAAAREAGQGRMREVILVGVDNYPERRRWEYNPPGDTYPGEQPGRADAYLQFLVHNVRPTIDAHYRTLNDFRNTLVGGSSMGGIFSIYAGFETNVFGGVLAMSPAVTRAPNYAATLPGKPKRPRRLYLDTGTSEGQIGTLPGGYYWDEPWSAYDSFLAIGYAPNADLTMRIGCGHGHNEAAWRERLPGALRFLLDVRDEPNRLALETHPPRATSATPAGEVGFTAQQHVVYRLEGVVGPPPGTNWLTLALRTSESLPWSAARVTGSPPAAAQATWRLVGDAAP